jgi:hypothetical protein
MEYMCKKLMLSKKTEFCGNFTRLNNVTSDEVNQVMIQTLFQVKSSVIKKRNLGTNSTS